MMRKTVCVIAALIAPSFACPLSFQSIVVADQHDGDQKELLLEGSTLTILPYANDEDWVITATVDPSSCAASVDFNVPGKPSPPPVDLTATFYELTNPATEAVSVAVGFTDPTATISATPTYPVNFWIQVAEGSIMLNTPRNAEEST